MKVVLIEPNPIMNKGLLLFLNELDNIDFVKSYSLFEHFLTKHSKAMQLAFDVYIINVSYTNDLLGVQYLNMINDMLVDKSILVIHRDRKQPDLKTNTKNRITYFKIENNMDELSCLIKSVQQLIE